MINQLFIELIQVSIGCRVCLSHTPTADEWGELYSIAKKQSLVGVCFAGVQRLQNQCQEPPEMLYLTWMGMAAKIQQRNQIVDEQCGALQKRLSAKGFRSCILKGQGVGRLYAEHLRGLRQSGDIDIFVDCGFKDAMTYCIKSFGHVDFDYMNAHIPIYEDTEVELHWTLQVMTNLFYNAKLQRWVESNKNEILGSEMSRVDTPFSTPTLKINRFYILLHAYNHMMGEGLGLRQLMDYYFVLRSEIATDECKKESCELMKSFGMKKFASAVMWIMQDVFGLDAQYLLCETDAREGRFVLKEVLAGGNFGHHDSRTKRIGKGKWGAILSSMQHSARMFTHYPSPTLWMPIWMVYHYIWKKCNYRSYNI